MAKTFVEKGLIITTCFLNIEQNQNVSISGIMQDLTEKVFAN